MNGCKIDNIIPFSHSTIYCVIDISHFFQRTTRVNSGTASGSLPTVT